MNFTAFYVLKSKNGIFIHPPIILEILNIILADHREVEGMAEVRCFIAVNLDEKAKSALHNLQEQLKQRLPANTVRWTQPDSIHLTLQFLGNVPLQKIPAITTSLADGYSGLSSFLTKINGTGCFPNTHRPSILWAGLDDSQGLLAALSLRTGEIMAPLGFPPEQRPFSPHLTIGRVRKEISFLELKSIGEQMLNYTPPLLYEQPVKAVYLMKSDLKPEGPVYSVLEAFPLNERRQ
jgi:RNA 2',3'-cyclic 3'-phosphodiesterase